MNELKAQTAEALLTAIKDKAASANMPSLESLARAYALVVTAESAPTASPQVHTWPVGD
ncbi:hypothetical protein [Nocardia transvalensis]|uniref:hypothetical protein n=1 Tax=Nocardia transvalensis TaxID=37333 RepID=UPI001893BD57|nr:hypothetical protein [Nocardia transvalensis]MBF6330265.1 hypothetical protein [Nocardia transvalensis]